MVFAIPGLINLTQAPVRSSCAVFGGIKGVWGNWWRAVILSDGCDPAMGRKHNGCGKARHSLVT